MDIIALVISGFAAILSVAAAVWIYKLQAHDNRSTGVLEWRRKVFSDVASHLWGLTEPDDLSNPNVLAVHQSENLKIVSALNVSAFVFADTDASNALEAYRKNASIENAIRAIGAMATECGVKFPDERFDRTAVFGPRRYV